MKIIGIILASFFLLAPTSIFAQDVSGICASLQASCTCSSVDGSDTFTSDSVTSVGACINDCTSALSPSSYGYSVDCPTGQTVAQGNFDATTQTLTDTTFAPPQLGVQIPGLTFTPATREGSEVISFYLAEYVQAWYQFLIGASAIIAIVMIMIGGLQWMMARGDATMIGKAKTRIGGAVTGLVLVLFAFTIAGLIDPRALDLDALRIKFIEKSVFISNETPSDFTEDFVIVEHVGNNGVGWDGMKMYDQKAYADVAYGPDDCLKENSGNIKSSGCGVTAFAMVASSLSSNTLTPPDVAPSFFEEGFRPICQDGCGCNGTHSDAYVNSSLLTQNGLVGERIGIDKVDEIFDMLKNGDKFIVSYRTSSGGGHYVVLAGIDSSDMLMVNNPWGGTKELRPKEWLASTIRSAVRIGKAE